MRFQKRVQHFFIDMRDMMRLPRFFVSAFFSVFLLALTAALPLWRIVPLGSVRPFIPLHYNIYLGVDRLGPWQQIFILPILGFSLFLFNLFLQTFVFPQEKLLAFLISIATTILELIFFVAMILIVLMNISYAS